MIRQWPLVKLAEVLTQFTDYIEAPEPREYKKLSVKLYGKGVVLDSPADGMALKMKRHQLAKAGQVILSEIWGKKGAIGFVPSEGEGALCTSHFFLFDVRADKLDRRWLRALFDANYLQMQLDAEAKGTTGYAAVRPKTLLACEIPLPPLSEQRRIVARIEELAAQINEARTLRQQAAEEAEALIGAKASELFGKCLERRAIDALAEVRGGIQKGPHRAPGANPVRYLTVAHVHRNRILTDSPRYFEVSPDELQRWRLVRGDVLIIEGNGSADQIGRTALFRGEIENCVHQNHVIRIRPNQQRVSSEFLNTFLNSPAGQGAVQDKSRTTSGLRSLSVGRIKAIEVPVPLLTEQRRIVAELDALQAEVDALKRLQVETAAELDALLPAILDRAFKGEL
jgi:type I restriction enzyme S subunit